MKLKAFIAAALALLLITGCGAKEEQGPSASPAETQEAYDETPGVEATFRRATLYYVCDEGYLVPVTKLIPWEQGIAKACLSYMVSTPENLSAAREMGLSTVIPSGTELSLSINDGNALVDLNGLPAAQTREEELSMVEAIVNTLVEFPTVNSVTITREGQGGVLENGTELPVRQGAYPLNPEEDEAETSASGALVTLYFPNESGALTVPLSRRLGGEGNIYSLVRALMEGTKLRGLRNCFPEGTLLLGATVENGTVTLNFSDDFKSVAETEGLFTLVCRSVWLTLGERIDFERLRIQVNGTDYAPESTGRPGDINPAA